LYSGSGTTKDLSKCLNNHPDPSSHLSAHDWEYLVQLPIYSVAETEAARGGAVLSAAELESAKQYIDLDEYATVITYAVSFSLSAFIYPVVVEYW
jgi:hypothetical protein